MAIGQRVAPAEQPWDPIRRDDCLRVLARTGRADCRRPCACFPPFSGSIAMSAFCVARLVNARGNIEWLCIQEHWNPEVVLILGTAACYRRATVGSIHDDVHPDNPALYTGAVRPILALWRASCSYRPATASRASARNAASFFVHFVGVHFCGGWCSHIFQWAHWVARRGFKLGSWLNGLAHLEFHGASSPW